MRWPIFGIGLIGAGAAMATTAGDTMPTRDRGEDIYFGRTGAISCAGCHGLAAQGGGEGGTSIPPLKDIAGNTDADSADFCRALRTGEMPDGRTLSGYMPRLDLGEANCAALFAYIAGLSGTTLPGLSDGEVRLEISADPRNPAQLAWRDQLAARFARINADGGLHGRKVRVLDPGEEGDAFFSITLGNVAAPPRNTFFSMVMRGEAVVPFIRTIETSRRDEADVVLGLYPKAAIALFTHEEDAAARGAFADRAADNGARITGFNDCGSPAAEVVIVLDTPQTGLPDCPAARTILVSLRNVPLGDGSVVARFSARQTIELAVPVPMDKSFGESADRIGQVVIGTLRAIGRHPDKSDSILAFEHTWRLKAARPGSMFAGITVGTIGGNGEGRWIAVP